MLPSPCPCPPATRSSLLGRRDPPAPTSMRTDCPGVTASCPAISAPGPPSDDPLPPPPAPTISTEIWVARAATVHRVPSELALVLEGRFAVTVRPGGDAATAGAAAAARATGAPPRPPLGGALDGKGANRGSSRKPSSGRRCVEAWWGLRPLRREPQGDLDIRQPMFRILGRSTLSGGPRQVGCGDARRGPSVYACRRASTSALQGHAAGCTRDRYM